MKNFDSIFAAYLLGWAVFFAFYLTVAKRASALRGELDRLKATLNRGK